jgi:methionyl aminopeptidase
MPVHFKTLSELEVMRRAGELLCSVLDEIEEMVSPGVSTGALDRRAEAIITGAGARPAFKGYRGFPGTLCTSVNDQVVHGIPSDEVVLSDGDIVSVDCGLEIEGFYADSARTLAVGNVSDDDRELLDVTRTCLELAIAQCKVGGRLSTVGAVVQRYAERHGCSVVREYSGHGIGRSLHEDPEVPNYGRPGRGMKMRPGLVIALEPMLNLGVSSCETLEDGWTVVTKDRRRSAHFEHTVAITKTGPWVLTAGA